MQGVDGIILDGGRTDSPGLVLVPLATISTVPAMNWRCSIDLESRITETNIDVGIFRNATTVMSTNIPHFALNQYGEYGLRFYK